MLLELFLCFAKIGLFTFGGGYAMIALIENACVEEKKWITQDEMMNLTIIAESTPGPISINCATFIGYKQKGILGAVAATIGVVFPSLIIIYLIALYFSKFMEIAIIANAFQGIKLAVGILILDAGIKMLKIIKEKTLVPCSILFCSLITMVVAEVLGTKVSTVALILFSGFINLIVSLCKSRFASTKKGTLK